MPAKCSGLIAFLQVRYDFMIRYDFLKYKLSGFIHSNKIHS